jgi:hypothetical protein
MRRATDLRSGSQGGVRGRSARESRCICLRAGLSSCRGRDRGDDRRNGCRAIASTLVAPVGRDGHSPGDGDASRLPTAGNTRVRGDPIGGSRGPHSRRRARRNPISPPGKSKLHTARGSQGIGAFSLSVSGGRFGFVAPCPLQESPCSLAHTTRCCRTSSGVPRRKPPGGLCSGLFI